MDRPVADTNEENLRSKIEGRIDQLENADANWANLTAAQKDQVLQAAVRGVAKLARIAVRRLDAA